jgi:elongation factor G
LAAEKRRELIETVSEVDDKLADAFLTDEPISSSDLEVYLETKNVFLKENNIHEL